MLYTHSDLTLFVQERPFSVAKTMNKSLTPPLVVGGGLAALS